MERKKFFKNFLKCTCSDVIIIVCRITVKLGYSKVIYFVITIIRYIRTCIAIAFVFNFKWKLDNVLYCS